MNILTKYGLIGLFFVAVSFSVYNSMLLTQLDKAKKEIVLLENRVTELDRVIAILQTQEQQNRELIAEQLNRERQLRKQATETERKYSDAIKNDECATRNAPSAVLDLLRPANTSA